MESTPGPIVDTHQHLWDLARFRVPWLERVPSLHRSFVAADYAVATAGLEIARTVYMEVDLDPTQQTAEAEFVIERCADPADPMAGGVISGRPAEPGFAAYIRPLAAFPCIKGVRQVLHGPATPAGFCLRPEFIAGIRLLGDLGLRYDLCLRPGELADGLELVRRCPATAFVLDHCGNGDIRWTPAERLPWAEAIARLAAEPNVVCKVSGIIATAAGGAWTAADLAPLVRHVVAEFGPDRVMFGGDWPVCTLGAPLREWVDALNAITADWHAEQRRALFHDNAVRFYGL
jgi:L-fuconolactonase